MKRRMLPILLSLALCLSLLPGTALAAEGDVTYIEYSWNASTNTLSSVERKKSAGEYTVIEEGTWDWSHQMNTQEFWCVVNHDITISPEVIVYGDVHLILQDGCTLTVQNGIRTAESHPPNSCSDKSLTIYGQSEGTGKLVVQNNGIGWGGNSPKDGTVTIHGGTVEATGGISGSSSGTVTIYNGTVTATGGGSAGIGGGGYEGGGGRVTIYGGTVEANGGHHGAGIGGSPGGSGGEVTIYGGAVTAKGGGNGAGIGGGGTEGASLGSPGGNGGEVIIYDGTVTATGSGNGAGIGGGQFGNPGSFRPEGNAVIFASSIQDEEETSNPWRGVIFEGNSGQVYGTSITPTEDFTIETGKTLTIDNGKTLVIQEGVTLTNEGTITNNGTIINHGTIINKNEGTLTGEGEVDGNPVTYEVIGVSLSSETLALVAGDSETLTATITPDKAASAKVTWESSDPNVATVTDGVVTAVAPGTATITATAGDISATCAVTVERPYVPPANPNYRIDVTTTEGGTVTKDPAAAKAGETVTLTPAPDEGYQVGTVTVTDRFGDTVEVTANPDGTYTFTMPNGQVRVNVTFVEVQPEPLPFTDVAEGDWFHDSVRYVYDNGLMDGVGDGQFAPNATTTRAQLVTILYRLAGEPDVSGDVGFTDVEPGLWYTDAVAWAAEKGIVNGISETEFSPAGDLTREQLATILFRYAESMGYDVSAQADLSGFPDAGDIQSYATEALSWAVAEGLLQGFEDESLQPGGTATRAQIATILMRFCEGVAE